jgi:hypothetical protein
MRVSQQFCGPVTITGAGNQVLELTSTDPAASVTRLMRLGVGSDGVALDF